MLKKTATAVILGCGEIGSAIYQLSCGAYEQVIVEDTRFPAPPPPAYPVGPLHVAVPGSLPDFLEVVAACWRKYDPEIVLVDSTTPPGRTDDLVRLIGVDRVVHTQIHGKHRGNRMRSDMLGHPRFVATTSDVAFGTACAVLEAMGHPRERVVRLSSPLAGELVKLLATTYFGYVLAWAQEVERVSDLTGVSYDELVSFTRIDTPDYELRGKYPGVIGGHCVMPNVEILRRSYPSELWDFIASSNRRKIAREAGGRTERQAAAP